MEKSSPTQHPSVCFVNMPGYHFFNPRNTIPTGGGELSLYYIATEIQPIYRPAMIVGDFGQPKIQQFGALTLYASVKDHAKHHAFNAFLLWKALREANKEIYVASTFGKGIFFTWLFCKTHRKKFVYVTGSDHECDKQYDLIDTRWLRGRMFEIALTHADSIVASVRHHQHLLVTHHSNLSVPITSIPLGMHIPADASIPQNKKHILWLARCGPWKNPLLFIELAKRFPHEKFVLVAAPQPGRETLFKQVQKAAAQCANITFIPGVPHQKAQQYFNEAKISVNTSDFEGFSMAFMQSGLGGTPIVTLNLNPDNVISEKKLGYCAEGDFERMATQLATLLSNKEDWQQKAENIARYMRENHDIKKVVRTWETLFINVMHKL